MARKKQEKFEDTTDLSSESTSEDQVEAPVQSQSDMENLRIQFYIDDNKKDLTSKVIPKLKKKFEEAHQRWEKAQTARAEKEKELKAAGKKVRASKPVPEPEEKTFIKSKLENEIFKVGKAEWVQARKMSRAVKTREKFVKQAASPGKLTSSWSPEDSKSDENNRRGAKPKIKEPKKYDEEELRELVNSQEKDQNFKIPVRPARNTKKSAARQFDDDLDLPSHFTSSIHDAPAYDTQENFSKSRDRSPRTTTAWDYDTQENFSSSRDRSSRTTARDYDTQENFSNSRSRPSHTTSPRDYDTQGNFSNSHVRRSHTTSPRDYDNPEDFTSSYNQQSTSAAARYRQDDFKRYSDRASTSSATHFPRHHDNFAQFDGQQFYSRTQQNVLPFDFNHMTRDPQIAQLMENIDFVLESVNRIRRTLQHGRMNAAVATNQLRCALNVFEQTTAAANDHQRDRYHDQDSKSTTSGQTSASMTGQKTFKCNIDECTKDFVWKNSLKRHIEADHYKKKFLCPKPDCPADFTQRSSLKYHVFKYHSELAKDFDNQPCTVKFDPNSIVIKTEKPEKKENVQESTIELLSSSPEDDEEDKGEKSEEI